MRRYLLLPLQNKHFCHCFGQIKIMSCSKAYIFLVTKHNSGLLLAIGPDLSTLVFQTNQDNYEEQVLGWNSLKNKPFLTERLWHVLAMSLVLGFSLRAGRGVSWTSWALTCANSCPGELDIPSSFIFFLGGGAAKKDEGQEFLDSSSPPGPQSLLFELITQSSFSLWRVLTKHSWPNLCLWRQAWQRGTSSKMPLPEPLTHTAAKRQI